ncbi:MAG: serine/threonine protein kinase, partial [Cyclobacteriaceae bacterium]
MNEESRLRELEDYKILDTASETALDEFVEIASCICNTPVSLITLLDNNRQWFKAVKGLNIKETP